MDNTTNNNTYENDEKLHTHTSKKIYIVCCSTFCKLSVCKNCMLTEKFVFFKTYYSLRSFTFSIGR